MSPALRMFQTTWMPSDSVDTRHILRLLKPSSFDPMAFRRHNCCHLLSEQLCIHPIPPLTKVLRTPPQVLLERMLQQPRITPPSPPFRRSHRDSRVFPHNTVCWSRLILNIFFTHFRPATAPCIKVIRLKIGSSMGIFFNASCLLTCMSLKNTSNEQKGGWDGGGEKKRSIFIGNPILRAKATF